MRRWELLASAPPREIAACKPEEHA